MAYKKENIALGIFVFSVVMVIILTIFALQKGITGRVVVNDEEKEVEQNIENKISCNDSDGKNYGVKGVVSYCDGSECFSESDFCSEKVLTEYYCEDDEKKSEENECSVDCDDGVCLDVVKKYKLSGGGDGSVIESSSDTEVSVASSQETGQTYELGELVSEKVLEVVKNDAIEFTINGNQYTIIIQDNTETQITTDVFGNINVGEEKRADLNSDDIPDLYIKVRSINIINKKIILSLRGV